MQKIKNDSNYEVSISEVQLDKVAQELKVLHRLPGDTRCDAMTLKSRLKAIMTLELSEGFFADKVVLVEGLEDKAIIQAIDWYKSKIFDSKGIVVPNLSILSGFLFLKVLFYHTIILWLF